MNISDVIVENDKINIFGDFISSGSVYRGYHLEQIDDFLIVKIEKSSLVGAFNGNFSIKIEHDMSGIKAIYFDDSNEQKIIWKVQ